MPNTYNIQPDKTLGPRAENSELKFVVSDVQVIDVYGDLTYTGGGFVPLDGSIPMTGDLVTSGIDSLSSGLSPFVIKLTDKGSADQFQIRDANSIVRFSISNPGVGNWELNDMGGSPVLFFQNSQQNLVLGTKLNVNSKVITNLAAPVNAADAASKFYVDSEIAAIPPGGTGDFMADGTIPMTGDIDMGDGEIINLSIIKMNAVDNLIFRDSANSNRMNIDQTGGVSFSYFNGTGQGICFQFIYDAVTPSWQFFVPVRGIEPVGNSDLTTKNYVDTSIAAIPPAGDFLPLTGGTLTGDLVMGFGPKLEVVEITASTSSDLTIMDSTGGRRFGIGSSSGDISFYNSTYQPSFSFNSVDDTWTFDKPVIMVDPVDLQDAATKNYVDTSIAAIPPAGDFMADGSVAMTGALDMGTSNVINVQDVEFIGTDGYLRSADNVVDVTTGAYIQIRNTNLVFTIADISVLALNAGTINMAHQLDISNNKIINLADPVNLQDAATKNYVDTVVLPLQTKLDEAMVLITALQAKVDAL